MKHHVDQISATDPGDEFWGSRFDVLWRLSPWGDPVAAVFPRMRFTPEGPDRVLVRSVVSRWARQARADRLRLALLTFGAVVAIPGATLMTVTHWWGWGVVAVSVTTGYVWDVRRQWSDLRDVQSRCRFELEARGYAGLRLR